EMPNFLPKSEAAIPAGFLNHLSAHSDRIAFCISFMLSIGRVWLLPNVLAQGRVAGLPAKRPSGV
ncbi:MAG: hypothetical protein KAG66_13480, partial [Methylococcales bacterium]|nr:hypothetical protein [Methylococcales bacterium]